MEITSATDLRHVLAEYDLTVAEFARRARMSPPDLSAVLHGRRRMGPVVRARIAQAVAELAASPPPLPAPVRPRGRRRRQRGRARRAPRDRNLLRA